MLKVCIDTNIWISGVVFSDKPAEVVTAAFNKKFELVLSQVIVKEVEKNLLDKFKFGISNTRRLINRMLQIADLYEPEGSVHVIPNHHTDNLILETAFLGRAKYLVTGDKEHLLPLESYKMVKIVNAAVFLKATQR
jgi:putative PIN family toxin of toxin-antitoxin system